MKRFAVLFSSLLLPVCLIGCGFSHDAVAGPNDEIRGSLMGGQQPIAGATITVWQAGTSYGAGATKMATTTTDSNGNFGFATNAYTCTNSTAPMYLTGYSGNPGGGTNVNVMQVAVIGPCQAGRTSFFVMNEVSTVVAAFALAQFADPTLGSATAATVNIGATCSSCASGTYNKGLLSAMNETVPALLTKSTGVATATATASGFTVTTEATKINTMANVLAACVNSTGQTSTTETTTSCGRIFNYAKPGSATTRPYTTWQVALMMALYPYNNVTSLYNSVPTTPPFSGLTATPSDWTLAISYTSTSYGLGVNTATSTNIAVDANGSVWFPTTTTATHGLAYFDPTDQKFHGPYATGLYHPQYVTVSAATTPYAYGNDLSLGRIAGTSVSSPGAGTTYSTGDGSLLLATGPLFVDNDGDIAFSGHKSTTAAYSYVLLAGGTSTKQVNSNAYPALPTGLIGFPNSDYGLSGSVSNGASTACYGSYVYGNSTDTGTGTNSSTLITSTTNPCVAGGVAAMFSGSAFDYVMTASTGNMLCTLQQGCDSYSNAMNKPMGVAFDSAGRLWIANSGSASVSILDVAFNSSKQSTFTAPTTVAFQHGTSHGGTMTTPYGIAIDGSGNVWVSNASCTTTNCTASSFTLTEIVGAASPVITPLATVFKNASFTTLPTS